MRLLSALAPTAALLAALAPAACSDLQPIEAGRCGNRIIDVGEACDEGGATDLCTAECRLSCQTADAAPASYVDNLEDSIAGGLCPLGQACGVDGLCAAPSGKFRVASSFELDVAQAEAGDVDGDHVADLVSTSATELRIRFGDADGAPLASTSIQPAPSATGPFLLADLDESGGVDMAIPTDGGVVPFFDVDGTLQHHPSPTLQIPREGAVVALDGIVAEAGKGRRPVLVYAEEQGTALVLRDLVAPDNPELARCETGGAVASGALRRGPLAVIAAGVGTGELLALGVDRATAPGVCIFAPASPLAPGDPGWTPRFFPLAAGARFEPDIAIPILWANVDGDACPELLAPVLTGAGAGVPGYTLLDSSAGCGFAAAATLTPSWSAAPRALGAGNLDRVGADELVNAANVFRVDSLTQVTAIGPPVGMDRLRVADFNGDGVVDIAGVDQVQPGEASREAVRLLRTAGPAGTWQATTAVVETLRPVLQIASGDYDGDRITDLALTEVISVNAQRVPTAMAVSVVYGQRSEIPQYQVVLETVPVVIATLGQRRGAAAEQDGADDLGVAIAATTAKVSASVLFGSAQRSLTAPLARSTGSPAAAVAAGPWANSDALLDLVVYADTSQYLWPQMNDSFLTTGAGTPSPIDARGLRDFAITSAATTSGSTTVVSITPSARLAAVGGVGACPTSWSGTGVPAAGPRPTLQARDLDGEPGDELLVTTQPAPGIQSVYVYSAIGGDCKLGQTAIASGHPLLGCDTAAIIEASAAPPATAAEASRREILAVCHPRGPDAPSQLVRFDYADSTYEVRPQQLQLPGRARRLMVGDFTGDGLEDALTITTVGSVDFATLLVQCAQTDPSCDL